MARRSDQVFQLSLTEIAFTIAFLLLLLLGYVVAHEQQARAAAEAALARVRSVDEARAELAGERRELEVELQAAGAKADDQTLRMLADARELRAERDRLRRRVEDLDARLSALAELQRRLAAATPASAPAIEAAQVDAALALQARVREALAAEADASAASGASATPRSPQDERARVLRALVATRALDEGLKSRLGRTLAPGEEAQGVRALVDAAAAAPAASAVAAETANLRGQVAFLRNRLGARGGRDYPPCWASDDGKVEFLLAITLSPEGVTAKPAWPARRDAQAQRLPGVAALLGGPWPLADFPARARPLLDDSRRRAPECRHYVELRSTIADAVQSDRARLMVEGVFYKVEERR